jgi:hypothetical protein
MILRGPRVLHMVNTPRIPGTGAGGPVRGLMRIIIESIAGVSSHGRA